MLYASTLVQAFLEDACSLTVKSSSSSSAASTLSAQTSSVENLLGLLQSFDLFAATLLTDHEVLQDVIAFRMEIPIVRAELLQFLHCISQVALRERQVLLGFGLCLGLARD